MKNIIVILSILLIGLGTLALVFVIITATCKQPKENHDRVDYLNTVSDNWVIILNDDQEAMPKVGGYLQVQEFAGDTVYVGSVENN